MLSEQGQREVGRGLQDALARLRRRRAHVQEQLGVLEAELTDLSRIEAALMATLEMAGRRGPQR